ncbi:MAG: DUF2642 domain-containing protein [Clostridia bacterium]|nr:DUF2642 domain-containing protein [Clostridia bacterium]
MKFDLAEKLRCLLDQPVRIYTDDERVITGMVVGVNGDFVRIHENCGDIYLVAICHITSIEEPHMKLLRKCCKKNPCRDAEYEEEFDEDEGCKKCRDRY